MHSSWILMDMRIQAPSGDEIEIRIRSKLQIEGLSEKTRTALICALQQGLFRTLNPYAFRNGVIFAIIKVYPWIKKSDAPTIIEALLRGYPVENIDLYIAEAIRYHKTIVQ